MEKIKTNIPKLDKLLGDGVERGESVLIFGPPGIDKATFAQNILFNRLEEGDCGLYFVCNKLPSAVRDAMRTFGWPLDKYEQEGRFAFIDAFSAHMGIPSDEKYVVDDPTDFNRVDKIIRKALKDYQGKNAILIVDSLSSLLSEYGEEQEILKKIGEWNEMCKNYGITAFHVFTNWEFDKAVINRIKEMFLSIITFRAVEEKIIIQDYFGVEKVKGTQVKESKYVPFKIVRPVGVCIYVPKIIVIGPYNSGKTTFIRAISKRAISVERMGTTISLDHGYVEYMGFAVDVFGTPGQERFEFMIEILARETFGVILVIDSTKPETFERAKEMMEKAKLYGLPLVIAANKQDLPGALPPEEIRKRMKLPEDVPIIPCIATQGKGVWNVIKALFDKILGV